VDALTVSIGIATILGNLALVVTVWLLLREVRENTRLTRAANAQTMVELASPFYLGIAQDRAMAELCARSVEDYESLDGIDRRRYRSLLVGWLIFYENIFYQRRHRFLDRHAFLPWWRDLHQFIREHNLGRHWDGLKDLFQEEFARAIDEMLVGRKREDADSIPPLTAAEARP
jgi:hypothetical protein